LLSEVVRSIWAEKNDLAADICAVAADPAFVARMAASGQGVDVRAPAKFGAVIDEQLAKLTMVAEALDIKPKQ
jgi:hypothetical protein